MLKKCLVAVFGAASTCVAIFMPGSAHPADVGWGCQVLLCAASASPSWHGVPYCVPPMERLIAEMAKPGFSWPICSSAGTGAPGFEEYGDCPAGYSIGYTSLGSGNHSSSEPSLCVKTINNCGSGGEHGEICETTSQPRPVREQPYYFDIRQSSGSARRFWFDLSH